MLTPEGMLGPNHVSREAASASWAIWGEAEASYQMPWNLIQNDGLLERIAGGIYRRGYRVGALRMREHHCSRGLCQLKRRLRRIKNQCGELELTEDLFNQFKNILPPVRV